MFMNFDLFLIHNVRPKTCTLQLVIAMTAMLVGQNTGCGFLLNSMFDFAERFNELQLTDEEVALFSALIIISAGNVCLSSLHVCTLYKMMT